MKCENCTCTYDNCSCYNEGSDCAYERQMNQIDEHKKEDDDLYKKGYNKALDDLCKVMKTRFFHQIGTQFDNAIIEMNREALKLKK